MSDPTESGQGVIVPYGPAYAVWTDGRVIPIPAGGSDTTTAGAPEGSTDEPAEPGTEGSGVQSDGGDEPQSSGGQEFIEPYLEGLDPRIRPHVEEKLEQFRKDQDAQVNKKLESVNEELSNFKQYADSPEELEVPVAFYSSMVNDPINTLEWLFDRFQQELGRDLRSEVQEMVMPGDASASGGTDPTQQLTQSQPGQAQEGGNEDPSKQPLTKADLDAYFEQKEQERQEQQKQEQQEEQQRQQVNSWVDEAAKKFSFPLDEDDPLRQTIITEAGRLFEQGQVKDGKQAVEMATESLVTKLKNKVGGSQKPNQLTTPKVANGGQAPHQQKPNINDPKARQDYMVGLLTGGAGSE